jgi:type I restriction enzyme, R subunit
MGRSRLAPRHSVKKLPSPKAEKLSRAYHRFRGYAVPRVAQDPRYINAKENNPHTARIAHDQALSRVMQALLKDDTKVYKLFVENDSFKRFVSNMVFELTQAG